MDAELYTVSVLSLALLPGLGTGGHLDQTCTGTRREETTLTNRNMVGQTEDAISGIRTRILLWVVSKGQG